MSTAAPGPPEARFGYSIVASRLHDPGVVDRLTASARTELDRAGGQAGAIGGLPHRPHLYLVATGGTERSLLDLVAERDRIQPDVPTILVAHGAHNSLPAALEALAALQQTGARGRIAYLDGVGDGEVVERSVTDVEAILRFRSSRVGLVGGASDWLVASSPGPDTVTRRWGPTVEVVDAAQMVGAVHSANRDRSDALAARFTSESTGTATMTPVSLTQAGAVGVALDSVVRQDGFDAVAVRCFDLLDDPGTSGCLALADLNDHGIVAGCEGDLPSTLAMMWIRFLLDQPSWMANPARIDRDANELVLAHCTVTPSMVDGFDLSTHFESGIGVGIAGRFASQPVTLVRIGGRDLDRCWIAEGRISASGRDPHLCRTQVTVGLDDRRVDELLSRPLGNHLVLAAGHHRHRFEQWWDLAIAD